MEVCLKTSSLISMIYYQPVDILNVSSLLEPKYDNGDYN